MTAHQRAATLKALGFSDTALDAALLLLREQAMVNAMPFGCIELHFDAAQMRLFRRDRMAAVQRQSLRGGDLET